MLIGYGLCLGTLVWAGETASAPRQFNVHCPASRRCPELEKQYQLCAHTHAPSACESFVAAFRELTAISDCQRQFDHTPTEDYTVPAIWLCGDLLKAEPERWVLEEYIDLLQTLKTTSARCFFASVEFRTVLDGHLAEEFRKASLREVRRTRKLGCATAGQNDHVQ